MRVAADVRDGAGRFSGVDYDPLVCTNVRHGKLPDLSGAPAAPGKCTCRLVHVDRVIDDGFAGRKDQQEEVRFTVGTR